MRKAFRVTLLAAAGLTFGLGADEGPGEKVFLVYSTDERNELAPCG